MKNQVFSEFERSELSDEIYAVFGRAMTVATRFDTSCKLLASLPLFKFSIVTKSVLSDEQFSDVLNNIQSRYKNLNRAIESLGLNDSLENVLKKARESRNELIHEVALGAETGFDRMKEEQVDQLMHYIGSLVLQIIKGDALISALISTHNNEILSNYPFSKEYETRYLNWVMERF